MAFDQETRRMAQRALGLLERLTIATERIAEMAEQDPLRAVDRLLAMGVDPADPVSTLETMEERSAILEDMQRNGSVRPQEATGATEGEESVAGGLEHATDALTVMAELEAALQMDGRPTPEQVAAARARAGERAGTRQPPTVPRSGDEEMDDLPASERWRMG